MRCRLGPAGLNDRAHERALAGDTRQTVQRHQMVFRSFAIAIVMATRFRPADLPSKVCGVLQAPGRRSGEGQHSAAHRWRNAAPHSGSRIAGRLLSPAKWWAA